MKQLNDRSYRLVIGNKISSNIYNKEQALFIQHYIETVFEDLEVMIIKIKNNNGGIKNENSKE